MKYIIMCGGMYEQWETPRHLTVINGESLIARTFRLLIDCGVEYEDIYVSTNNGVIKNYCESVAIQVLWHSKNDWVVPRPGVSTGDWCDAFYPTDEPTTYLMGDVVFSPEAIKKIVETETDDIEFFASAPPFAKNYMKPYAEPFAFKVVDTEHLKQAQADCRHFHRLGVFRRPPLAWEFWQVVKGTEFNKIDYTNYTAINDYTCDIDVPADAEKIERLING